MTWSKSRSDLIRCSLSKVKEFSEKINKQRPTNERKCTWNKPFCSSLQGRRKKLKVNALFFVFWSITDPSFIKLLKPNFEHSIGLHLSYDPLTTNGVFWLPFNNTNSTNLYKILMTTTSRPGLRYAIICTDSNWWQGTHHFSHSLFIGKLEHHWCCKERKANTTFERLDFI